MSFIHDDFMLHTPAAKKLYHDFAEKLPIIDYHCHLVPKMIADNYQFRNITDLFLGGDHYKWRAMRSAGVDEEYITGSASDYEKFKKWAYVVSLAIGSPLYHWTHLELKRYFDIDEPLTPETADDIWNRCNELLAREDFRAKALIEKSNVAAICTTDDPADDLRYHKQLAESGFATKVLPTFRPDKAVEIGKETFIPYMESIGIKDFDKLREWIVDRIIFFHENGCRISDHALEYVPYAEGNAKAVFNKRMNGSALTKNEEDIFKTAMLSVCAKEYSRLDWAMQLHIGALRNNNTPMFQKLGPDTGFDSANDLCIAEMLSRLLDSFETAGYLPKTILYTLNPKDNYVLGTMLGNFQKAPTFGKIQFGSAWWINDHRDGMVEQMKALANTGMLSTFVGMLTDSRSFVSYARHEYFRRILCNLIGEWVDKGEYPEDWKRLGEIVSGICYYNAENYFKL